ncbi:hypothetical protein DOTSEDRAFT_27038 [Dothistroma septosporum NZE10]|uniref:Uncharacterized protein n=1 Tax=Dothistroma septosporum (strain NZE10 / CBS 128990) TaxID=675120 RepID=N1PH33_DOTSN|nr:hypothetical protein DOTSEDRAFT_27038 [Dothistroma septosporum NZE10]
MGPTTLTLLTFLNIGILSRQLYTWYTTPLHHPSARCIIYTGSNFTQCTSWAVTNLRNADQKFMDTFLESCGTGCKTLDTYKACELVRVVDSVLQYECRTEEEMVELRRDDERIWGRGRGSG